MPLLVSQLNHYPGLAQGKLFIKTGKDARRPAGGWLNWEQVRREEHVCVSQPDPVCPAV